MNLIVLTKPPGPGRVKTRLCPPLTPRQAADVAEAAIRDTLATVSAVQGARPVVVLDGAPGPWLPHGMRILPQRGRTLDERIDAAFADVGPPAILIGMDTPQVSEKLIRQAVATMSRPGVDAVIGPAEDGGWWIAGLRAPHRGLFTGVRTSTPDTFREQHERMSACGLRVLTLPALRDVDTIDDAIDVALSAPRSRFATALRASLRGAQPLTEAAS
jgi:rSAM/selenodomain-associated transferase 1